MNLLALVHVGVPSVWSHGFFPSYVSMFMICFISLFETSVFIVDYALIGTEVWSSNIVLTKEIHMSDSGWLVMDSFMLKKKRYHFISKIIISSYITIYFLYQMNLSVWAHTTHSYENRFLGERRLLNIKIKRPRKYCSSLFRLNDFIEIYHAVNTSVKYMPFFNTS